MSIIPFRIAKIMQSPRISHNKPKDDSSGIEMQKQGYFWSLIHTMSLWTLRIIRFVTWRGSDHSANTRARPDIPKAKLDIVGPDEAERRARRLLQILGLPQLPIGPFIEALSIDNAKNNSVLALCGDLVHKMLLTDAAREASSRFTAGEFPNIAIWYRVLTSQRHDREGYPRLSGFNDQPSSCSTSSSYLSQ